MDDSVTQSMITTASDKTKVVLYMGEGTSADELLIMTVNDESRMDPEIENVQQHLTDMQQSFQDYLPKEAKKIDDAVILQSGKYIVACVCSDKDTAGSVIREQLKGKGRDDLYIHVLLPDPETDVRGRGIALFQIYGNFHRQCFLNYSAKVQ